MKKIFPYIIIGAGIVLAGCSNQTTSDNDSTYGTKEPVQVDQGLAASSGDVEKDFVEIDAALETLNVDNDFDQLDADLLLAE